MRCSPVRHVIIERGTSGALLLIYIRQLPDVTIVVIRPTERYILWNFHSCTVEINRFFVQPDDLRHFRQIRVNALRKDLPLVRHHLLKKPGLYLRRTRGFQPAVMLATHSYGVKVLVRAICFQAFIPVPVTSASSASRSLWVLTAIRMKSVALHSIHWRGVIRIAGESRHGNG